VTSERCETGLEIEAHFGFYQSSNVPRELGREQIPILTYRGNHFLPEDLRYTPLVLAILKGPRVRIAPSPSLFQRLNSAAGGERKYPVRDFGRGARSDISQKRGARRDRHRRRAIEPGDTVLTRMRCGTNASAQRSVSKISAALAAPYWPDIASCGDQPEIDATLMTAAPV
jgi:hypothetical protein